MQLVDFGEGKRDYAAVLFFNDLFLAFVSSHCCSELSWGLAAVDTPKRNTQELTVAHDGACLVGSSSNQSFDACKNEHLASVIVGCAVQVEKRVSRPTRHIHSRSMPGDMFLVGAQRCQNLPDLRSHLSCNNRECPLGQPIVP